MDSDTAIVFVVLALGVEIIIGLGVSTVLFVSRSSYVPSPEAL